MARNYPRFYAICKAIDKTKQEVVSEFTDGRTESCNDLTDQEFQQLFEKLTALQVTPRNWGPPPGDLQRKKMIGIARSMHWGRNTEEIISNLNEWCLKQKFKKRLMDLSVPELGALLSILEGKVLPGYLKGIKK